jgi:hypothetical protein
LAEPEPALFTRTNSTRNGDTIAVINFPFAYRYRECAQRLAVFLAFAHKDFHGENTARECSA